MQRETLSEEEGRDQSEGYINQGMPGGFQTLKEAKKESSLKTSEVA